jgi:uracil-DNA glycosylase family 4
LALTNLEHDKDLRVCTLTNLIKSCNMCKELVRSRSRVVPGYGDLHADVLYIGEAPGALGADITGVPFTRDRSGVFLQKMLNIIGMNKTDPKSEYPDLRGAYITNIVRCNPRKKNSSNRTPTKKEIQNCGDYLSEEIDIINPRIIVTLGVHASKSILGKEFKGKDFGKIKKLSKYYVLPLWHPAFVIRGGGKQRINEMKYQKYFLKVRKLLSSVDEVQMTSST